MGRLFAIEIIYRGIFQKTLATRISRAIVLAAHHEGKMGISFGRYGDSPERNGIPAKNFAIVATDEVTLQDGMAKYEPKEVDVTICVDDTLCKGVESWAWYGLQPVNRLLKPGGTLIVTSRDEPETLIAMSHRKESPYQFSIVKGTVSFSGLWVFKDDHTDVRILGAIARILPELFSLQSVQKAIVSSGKMNSRRSPRQSLTSARHPLRFGPTRAIPKCLTSSICRSGMRWAKASPFPAFPPDENGRSHVPRQRWISARSQSHLQEIQHPNHAAGGEFRYLHQVHAVLAAVPGLLLRRDAGRFVRREYGSLLRLRRVRGRLPGQGMRHHGQRDRIPATTAASGKTGGRTKTVTRFGWKGKSNHIPSGRTGSAIAGSTRSRFPEMLEIAGEK